jgi:arsenite methyltransferase
MTDASLSPDRLRAAVRSHYVAAALRDPPATLPVIDNTCCEGESSGAACCGPLGSGGGPYSAQELSRLPPGSNLGLGCGNPGGLANLRPGEVVLDLGSGAGVDCFLAGDRVGPSGRVIGVDMTPEMVSRAREIVRTSGRSNVEFRLGEIEHLPVEDCGVDVVLSNCVINLALDKHQVYREAFRVLRPGGRLAVADVIATRSIAPEDRADPDRWSSCSSGALTVAETERALRQAGFSEVEVSLLGLSGVDDSLRGQAELGVVPGSIRAVKPAGR